MARTTEIWLMARFGRPKFADRDGGRLNWSFVARALTAILLVVTAWELVGIAREVMKLPVAIGLDIGFYLDRTEAWLAGEGFYRERQLAGPYIIENGDALYPPTSILLFLPWALGAPLVLWWLIPLGTIAIALWRIQPPVWTWPILAAILVYPRTWIVLVLGNPSMWAIAAIVAGMVWGWPAAVAFVKPAFAPFALVGIRHRSWWAALAALVVISLPFGTMWLDYARVLLDGRSLRGLEYQLGELPIAIALLAAWMGRLQVTRAKAERPEQPGAATPLNGGTRLGPSGR